MLSRLFQGKTTNHPLENPQELRRALNEFPADNAFRTLDEVMGWLESLQDATLAGHVRFGIVRQLDEAAQPHLRRLTRDYLLSPRLSRSEEKRLSTIIRGFWSLLARQYERCLEAMPQKDKSTELLKPHLLLLITRLLGALGAELKWSYFLYSPIADSHWSRLGQAYLLAEAEGLSDKDISMYPATSGSSSPAREYVKSLVFQASSLDCLLPRQVELAERLIAHLLPEFAFSRKCDEKSVYWVDANRAMSPMRLAKVPRELSPGLRFIQPGAAETHLLALVKEVQQVGEVPASLNLGGVYPAKVVLPVMHHLASCWSPIPPQRQSERHRVKHRVTVLSGLVNAFIVFSPDFGSKPMGLPMESWVVENVSRGGFGATIADLKGDWLKVGAFLALQPEGAENWIVGLVRRYRRLSNQEARVGIETLSRRVVSIDLRPKMASSYAIVNVIPGLWLQDDNPRDEVRLILPVHSFDSRHSMEFEDQGRRIFLDPIALVEQGGDYEVVRYRATVAAPSPTQE